MCWLRFKASELHQLHIDGSLIRFILISGNTADKTSPLDTTRPETHHISYDGGPLADNIGEATATNKIVQEIRRFQWKWLKNPSQSRELDE